MSTRNGNPDLTLTHIRETRVDADVARRYAERAKLTSGPFAFRGPGRAGVIAFWETIEQMCLDGTADWLE